MPTLIYSNSTDFLFLVLGILLSFVITGIFGLISFFLIIRQNSIEKLSSYECGFNPFSAAWIPFDVHFYLVALLFLIFDLEIMFFVPWVLNIFIAGVYGYVIFFIFFLLLLLGFLYEWKLGALNW